MKFNMRQTSQKIIRGFCKFVPKPMKSLYYYGNTRYCPICAKNSRCFMDFGIIPRYDAKCPHCESLERDRLSWLFLNKKTSLFDGNNKDILHVAPEPCLEKKFAHIFSSGYITADLYNPRAMVKMDITDIKYPNKSFDAIYCSHVLEHVNEDKKAMSEFYRILKSDGFAILNVPINTDKTFEDPSITNPADRLKAFGKEDHVRIYGPDYIERLQAVGFKVNVIKVDDFIEKNDAIRMGLTSASGEVYYCKK